MTQEEFLLKWNDHHASFFTIVEDLCRTEQLCDVTLACGGQVFETHKLILSVCSPYFRTLLNSRPDKHPIVYLKDVNPKHLEQLLSYMYRGEINVLQEDLGPLIETARGLQIKVSQLASSMCAVTSARLSRVSQMQATAIAPERSPHAELPPTACPATRPHPCPRLRGHAPPPPPPHPRWPERSRGPHPRRHPRTHNYRSPTATAATMARSRWRWTPPTPASSRRCG